MENKDSADNDDKNKDSTPDVSLYHYFEQNILKYYMTFIQVLIVTKKSKEELKFLSETDIKGFCLTHKDGNILFFETPLLEEWALLEQYKHLAGDGAKIVCFRQYVLAIDDRLEDKFSFVNVQLSSVKKDINILAELGSVWDIILEVRTSYIKKKLKSDSLNLRIPKVFATKCFTSNEVPEVELFYKVFKNEDIIDKRNRFHEVFMCHA